MRRAWIPLTLLAVIFGAIILRLGQLQLVLHKPMMERTSMEIIKTQRVKPVRGRLLDRKGRVLALTVEQPSIYASLREVPISREELISRLRRVVPEVLDADALRRLKTKDGLVRIKRWAEPLQAAAVEGLEIPGIRITHEPRRLHPAEPLAEGLLGSVSLDGYGSNGLERQLNPLLEGNEEVRILLRDALGRVFAEEGDPAAADNPAKDPGATGPFDIYLTLDAALQGAVEARIQGALARHDARLAVAVVQDIRTGALRAAAGARQAGAAGPLAGLDPNYPASFAFEPGSVVKPLTVAWALSAGIARESTVLDCEGGKFKPMPGVTIEDHEPYGNLRLGEVLAFSSNIGLAKLGLQLGRESLYAMFRSFGFGSKTALPVTGESVGLVRPPDDWSAASAAMVTFGYEIGATPLQLTQAFAALGGGGVLMEPQIVERITLHRESSALYALKPRRVRQAVSADTANRTLALMEEVVSYGTGKAAQISGCRVAGKTGTAQKLDPILKRYSKTNVILSFCGVLPLPRPVLSICVILDDPRKPKTAWASDLAAPLFRAIAEEALIILGINAEG